ncbi:hypothetical protein [Bacillus atrophaeus]|uniref:hypothetical protein n=1 Tax=Bacillus atrophaeus TaxID=1452 RepID=UPI0040430757
MLRRDRTLHKYLISTSALVTGNYLSEDLSIDLSFPMDTARVHMQDDPFSRRFLVVTLDMPPEHAPGVVLARDQSYFGEVFSILLSIILGKEFKFHGLLETFGMHRLPNFNFDPNSKYYLPFYNSVPRKDLEFSLTLDKFGLIEPLLLEGTSVSDEFRKKIIAAGKFYNRAIRIFPNEPELAYLDLITCGEIISSFYDDEFTDEELYDEQLLRYFEDIETLQNGRSIVNNIKSRLYQVKRKFTAALLKNLNDEFFSKDETIGNQGRITRENSEAVIKAGYDLRSLYVHEGLEFGRYVTPHINFHNEIVITQPQGLGQRATRTISGSPSFLGLERIIRFSLLSLINANGVPIEDRLTIN